MHNDEKHHVGDFVIALDAPCASLVSVITAVDGDFVECQYFNAELDWTIYRDTPIRLHRANVTSLWDFGVQLRVSGDSYICERERDGVATYGDGTPRKWQDSVPKWPVPKWLRFRPVGVTSCRIEGGREHA